MIEINSKINTGVMIGTHALPSYLCCCLTQTINLSIYHLTGMHRWQHTNWSIWRNCCFCKPSMILSQVLHYTGSHTNVWQYCFMYACIHMYRARCGNIASCVHVYTCTEQGVHSHIIWE